MTEVSEASAADIDYDSDEGTVIAVNQYKIGKSLGSGAFADVRLAEIEKGDETEKFAVKIFSKRTLKKKRTMKKEAGKMKVHTALENVAREIAIMKKLNHPGLVRLFEVIDDGDEDELFMFLEFVGGGQVMDYDPKAKSYFTEKSETRLIAEADAKQYVAEMVLGLQYLWAQNICHRDLKPENILLTDDGKIKITDFGVSHMFKEGEEGKQKNLEGTYHFVAPECTTGEEYDVFGTDVWAIGVTLYTFLYGTLPFTNEGGGVTELLDAIRNTEVTFPEKTETEKSPAVSAEGIDIMKKMLTKDPAARLNRNDILNHVWLADADVDRSQSAEKIEVTDAEVNAAVTGKVSVMGLMILRAKLKRKLNVARKTIRLNKEHAAGTGAAAVKELKNGETDEGTAAVAVATADSADSAAGNAVAATAADSAAGNAADTAGKVPATPPPAEEAPKTTTDAPAQEAAAERRFVPSQRHYAKLLLRPNGTFAYVMNCKASVDSLTDGDCPDGFRIRGTYTENGNVCTLKPMTPSAFRAEHPEIKISDQDSDGGDDEDNY